MLKAIRQRGNKMEGKTRKSILLVQFLFTLMIPDLVHSMSYPIFNSKRFGKEGPPHLPALVQMTYPAARIPTDFEVPDYDDNYSPYELMPEQENYPLAPIYGYAQDQPVADPFIEFEEGANEERNYPYGREAWIDEADKDDKNAFLRSLMLSQMDQDPEENEARSEIVYGTPVEYSPDYEDEERDRTWYYGVPVYEERESSRGRKDDSVRQLESLARQMKAQEAAMNMENEELAPYYAGGIFPNRYQKKMNRSGRKNNFFLRDGFKTNDKRFYSPKKAGAKAGAEQNNKANAKDSDKKNKTEMTNSVPKTSPTGQKEFVLPRPASPVRKPLQRGVYTRNSDKVNVYEAIKKLMAKEEGLQKVNRPRIQKRFVLSEDQLTSQLSGLKRIAV